MPEGFMQEVTAVALKLVREAVGERASVGALRRLHFGRLERWVVRVRASQGEAVAKQDQAAEEKEPLWPAAARTAGVGFWRTE